MQKYPLLEAGNAYPSRAYALPPVFLVGRISDHYPPCFWWAVSLIITPRVFGEPYL